MDESFKQVIEQHLDLKRRNSSLEAALPLSNYLAEPGTPGEAGGAAFDTAEWTGKRRSGEQTDRPRSKPESWLESFEDLWSSGPALDRGDDH